MKNVRYILALAIVGMALTFGLIPSKSQNDRIAWPEGNCKETLTTGCGNEDFPFDWQIIPAEGTAHAASSNDTSRVPKHASMLGKNKKSISSVVAGRTDMATTGSTIVMVCPYPSIIDGFEFLVVTPGAQPNTSITGEMKFSLNIYPDGGAGAAVGTYAFVLGNDAGSATADVYYRGYRLTGALTCNKGDVLKFVPTSQAVGNGTGDTPAGIVQVNYHNQDVWISE